MSILTYTTYEDIRSACGLSTQELPDAVISLQSNEDALYLALVSVDLPDEDPGPGDLVTRFSEIFAAAEEDRTTKESQLLALTRLFAAYAVAHEIFAAGPMRAPKSITDSEASLTRFSAESTHTIVAENIRKKLSDYRYRIVNINNTSVTDTKPFLTLIGNATDPVTDS